MDKEVDIINHKLTQVSLEQETNRLQRWRMEELEQDCHHLSLKHKAFLSDILQSPQTETAYAYFSTMEEEVQSLHQQNLYALEDEKEQLQKEAKALLLSEERLLLERKRVLAEDLGERDETNGA